jgi:hypothetical protein
MATVVAALLLRSSGAWAEDGVRIDQMQPANPQSPFFYAEGPHKPFAEGVEFAAGLTLEYGRMVLKEVGYDEKGNRKLLATLVEDALLARLSGSITPVHWVSFDLSIPFGLFEHGDKAKTYADTPHSAAAGGVGDLRIGAHVRPLDRREIGVLLGGRFWAPFGTELAYLSDSRFRAEVDVGLAGEASRLLYGCTFSVAPGLFARRSGDRAAVACALHLTFGPILSVGLEPTASLITYTNSKDDASFSGIIEPLAAARLRFGGFRLGFGVGPDFGGAAGAAQIRGLINFAYVGEGKPPQPPPPPPPDRDLDKIIDSLDACPDEAGVSSSDPKQRGCPLRDRDADGIGDADDFCPDRAGVPHSNPKANGCPDTDNDGLPDPIDTCKNEPGKGSDGCPRYARLTSTGFQIQPPIEFDKKDDKLSGMGRAAIEELAATMRANPQIEQVSIGIGTKGAKPKVSDKYAQQILIILRAGNLDVSRYEVVLRDDLRAGTVVVRLVR